MPLIGDYKQALLNKISSDKQVIRSLKTKSNTGSAVQDDAWAGPSFDKTTLDAAVDAVFDQHPV